MAANDALSFDFARERITPRWRTIDHFRRSFEFPDFGFQDPRSSLSARGGCAGRRSILQAGEQTLGIRAQWALRVQTAGAFQGISRASPIAFELEGDPEIQMGFGIAGFHRLRFPEELDRPVHIAPKQRVLPALDLLLGVVYQIHLEHGLARKVEDQRAKDASPVERESLGRHHCRQGNVWKELLAAELEANLGVAALVCPGNELVLQAGERGLNSVRVDFNG